MTQILSVISPDWAMQASDRRLTWKSATGVSEHDDGENKAVFVAERLTFAYTGLADIGGTPADEWFQGQLGRRFREGMGVEDAFDDVRAMLSQYFAAQAREPGPQAFVGVGWTDASFRERVAVVTWIANHFDEDGQRLVTIRNEFRCGERRLDHQERFFLHASGIGLPSDALVRLNAQIDHQLESDPEPEPVARLLIDAIRAEAAERDEVGPGVMVNNLPRAPGPREEVLLVGKLPDKEVRTFTYLGADGFDGRYLGPLVVGSDGNQMGDFMATGRSVGPLDSGAGMAYRPASAPPAPRGTIGQAVRAAPKIGRNDLCWCESGKKFKKCHGA